MDKLLVDDSGNLLRVSGFETITVEQAQQMLDGLRADVAKLEAFLAPKPDDTPPVSPDEASADHNPPAAPPAEEPALAPLPEEPAAAPETAQPEAPAEPAPTPEAPAPAENITLS